MVPDEHRGNKGRALPDWMGGGCLSFSLIFRKTLSSRVLAFFALSMCICMHLWLEFLPI